MAGAASVPDSLERLETTALGSLDLVDERLARLLGSLRAPDADLAEAERGWSRRIAATQADVHEELLRLIASGRPNVSELRVVAALFDLLPCVVRMGRRCAAVTQATMRLDPGCRDEDLCQTIERMGALTQAQVSGARETFRGRDADLAYEIAWRDRRVGSLGRRSLDRLAVLDADPGFHDWAVEMLVVARNLEQISADAVEMAEQALSLVVEPFEEMAYVDWRTAA